MGLSRWILEGQSQFHYGAEAGLSGLYHSLVLFLKFVDYQESFVKDYPLGVQDDITFIVLDKLLNHNEFEMAKSVLVKLRNNIKHEKANNPDLVEDKLDEIRENSIKLGR